MDTLDRLQALHAGAARQHVHFEKSKRRRTARSRCINAAIAITALATAATSGTEMPTPAATTALAAMLLVTLLQRRPLRTHTGDTPSNRGNEHERRRTARGDHRCRRLRADG